VTMIESSVTHGDRPAHDADLFVFKHYLVVCGIHFDGIEVVLGHDRLLSLPGMIEPVGTVLTPFLRLARRLGTN